MNRAVKAIIYQGKGNLKTKCQWSIRRALNSFDLKYCIGSMLALPGHSNRLMQTANCLMDELDMKTRQVYFHNMCSSGWCSCFVQFTQHHRHPFFTPDWRVAVPHASGSLQIFNCPVQNVSGFPRGLTRLTFPSSKTLQFGRLPSSQGE